MPFLFKLSNRVARMRSSALLLAVAATLAACEAGDPSSLSAPTHPSFVTSTGAPAAVTDLAAAMTDSSATLTFTEVDDGTGAPASYDIRDVPGRSISWGASTPSVSRGTCATPVAGTSIGAKRTCTVLGLTPSTAYSFQLVSYRGTLRVDAVFGSLSNVAQGTTTSGQPAPTGVPGAVTDLAVAARTDSGLTLGFTEVGDGAGRPASYDVRYAAGSAITWGASVPSVSRGTCATPVAGTSIGAKRTCTVLGLTPGTTYSVELVAYRGTLNVNAVFGALSNVASGATAAAGSTPAAVATVGVSPAAPSVAVGQTLPLTATAKDSAGNVLSGRPVSWASSNGSVATVSGAGLVTGVAAGAATITATSEGKSGTATVTVTAPPTTVTKPGTVTDLRVASVTDTGVTLAFTEVTNGSGGAASYDIRSVPGNTLTWGAGAPSVSRGTCATPVAGTTVGAQRTCTVLGLAGSTAYSFQLVAFRGTLKVNAVFGALSDVVTGTTAAAAARPVATVSVSPATASVPVGGTVQLSATPKDSLGRALTGLAVTWTRSNAGVASVSATGLVTGVGAGTATITATSGGKSGTATVTVTAQQPPPPPPSGSCSGACRYVDGAAGNDANAGTSTAPWRTIQHAADAANPGDTVIVNDGVYTGGSNVVTVGRSGTASAWLVFRAAHRWGAVLDGRNNASAVGFEINGSYVRVEGFQVRGTSRYGIDAYNGHDVDVVANNVHDVGHVCTDDVGGRVGIDAYARNLTIERNVVHDVGRFGPGEQGCSPSTGNWQNHDHGIYQGSEYSGQSDNLVVRNNIFYHFTHGWAIQRYDGSGTSVNGLTIVNNTFVGANPWRDGQIIIATGASNVVISNNIFYQPTTAGIWFDTGGLSNVTVSNNLSFGAAVSTGLSGVASASNLVNVDPRFVSVSGLDFHVQSGSPTIGAGMTLSGVPNDFDGYGRIGAYTIGAYQFH